MAPLTAPPVPGPTPTSKMAPSPKFIGAVEDEWELYSDDFSDYTVGAPIGFGASSIVYAAEYRPRSRNSKRIPCALKVLDLDSLPPHALALLQRETTLMSLSKHPNVLRVRGSWMDGHKLYIALRLMNKGSAADVMRYGWPGGMEEDVIRCILRQALQGLNYLHVNGFIHRDVKAANFLIDDDGTVLLGDLGVAADLAEDTSRPPVSQSRKPHMITAEAAVRAVSPAQAKRPSLEGAFNPVRPRMGKRKSFVGTPCWMAPEVIQARQYDSSADIWSFGITALELAQGRPPRSRESSSRVLVRIIQEDAPSLDRDNCTFKYSQSFHKMITACLEKDPTKRYRSPLSSWPEIELIGLRPTAEELLQSSFFKGSKEKSYLVGAILKDLPPLSQRQERRVARNIVSAHGTVDSWDFATTVNSPSLVRQAFLDEAFDEENTFKRRSNIVSWVEEQEEEAVALEPESSPEGETDDPIFSEPEFPGATTSESSLSSRSSIDLTGEEDAALDKMAPLPPPSMAISEPVPVPKVPMSAADILNVPTSSSFNSSLSVSPNSSSFSSSSSPSLWRKIKGLRKAPGERPQDTVVGRAKF
ncbi:unnamed protein product [Mycena citricolor]|uniref:Protein kinase domain-containing protein n=1 Tax=Mycena citricolor TaxID=2018698 RepID=A0AAD2HPW4_9AGAR|nr:unnamed protein product [Mycena citricolor]